MPLFPAFLKLDGCRCVVIGAGRVAQEKIAGLLRAGATVRVVAPHATPRVRAWARAKKICWNARSFRPSDLAGAFLAVAATSSPAVHATIYSQARRRGVLCNVVDDPEHCDFYCGAVVRRGALQIAISTEGHSPALAQRLRKKIESDLAPEYAAWLEEIGALRQKLFGDKKLTSARRNLLLHRLASESSFKEFQRASRRRNENPADIHMNELLQSRSTKEPQLFIGKTNHLHR